MGIETPQKPKPTMSMVLKKTGLFVLAIFLAKAVIAPLISSLFFNDHVYKPHPINNTTLPAYTMNKVVSLKDIVDSIEISCPIKIDSVTTLKSVVPKGNDTLEATYEINIIKRNYDMKIFKKSVCKEITPSEINAGGLNNRVGFEICYIYKYIDKNEDFMFNIYFLPSNGYKGK